MDWSDRLMCTARSDQALRPDGIVLLVETGARQKDLQLVRSVGSSERALAMMFVMDSVCTY